MIEKVDSEILTVNVSPRTPARFRGNLDLTQQQQHFGLNVSYQNDGKTFSYRLVVVSLCEVKNVVE